jgi:hypothetical protein
MQTSDIDLSATRRLDQGTSAEQCPVYQSGRLNSIPGPPFASESELRHATPAAVPGGTPDPREPALPGWLLTLRCARCGGEYARDYIAGQGAVAEGPDALR